MGHYSQVLQSPVLKGNGTRQTFASFEVKALEVGQVTNLGWERAKEAVARREADGGDGPGAAPDVLLALGVVGCAVAEDAEEHLRPPHRAHAKLVVPGALVLAAEEVHLPRPVVQPPRGEEERRQAVALREPALHPPVPRGGAGRGDGHAGPVVLRDPQRRLVLRRVPRRG